MSHELSLRADGTAEMFSLRESPWHKLGRVLTEELKDEEVAEAAGLNWSVTERPIYRELNGSFEQLDGEKVLARSDNDRVLGVVSKDYRVFQNEELIQLMRRIAKDTPVVWETAGVLHYGKTTWCMGYLPELDIRVRETDASKFYMLLTNGHGNMRSLQIMPTLIRVVCANTLQAATVGNTRKRRKNAENKKFDKAALSEGYGIHHDGQLDKSVQEVVDAYEQFMKDKIVTQEIYEQMADTKMTKEGTVEYWDRIFKMESPIEADEAAKAKLLKAESTRLESLEHILGSATCQTAAAAGTLYGSFQAVTEYVDHVKSVRKRDGSNRLSVTQFGTGMKLKEKAFDLALDLVAVV